MKWNAASLIHHLTSTILYMNSNFRFILIQKYSTHANTLPPILFFELNHISYNKQSHVLKQTRCTHFKSAIGSDASFGVITTTVMCDNGKLEKAHYMHKMSLLISITNKCLYLNLNRDIK